MMETLKQMIQKMHPLTRPTLKNWGRMAAHPTGIRDFGIATAEDLNVSERVEGKLLKYSGTFADGVKYFIYGQIAGTLIYQSLIERLL